MKARLSVTAALVAFAMSSPVFAQSGNDTVVQSKLAQCQTIADPGLKAQCMDQARSMMHSGQQMQPMQQMPGQGQYRPGINSNLPPQDRRMNK
jgi:hypothetical protein